MTSPLVEAAITPDGHLAGYESYGQTGDKLGAGKDATTYELGTGYVYRIGHAIPALECPELAQLACAHVTREVAAYADLPADVQVARTLRAWVSVNRIHKIIERGEGEPLFPGLGAGIVTISELRTSWEDGIARAADIPAAHYHKLVRDEAELRPRNILMDYLGDENLLYDPARGFTIIDAEFEPPIPLRGKCMYHALIGMNTLVTLIKHGTGWQGNIGSTARNNTVTVLELLSQAGHQPRYRLLFKVMCEALDYVPDYATAAMVDL